MKHIYIRSKKVEWRLVGAFAAPFVVQTAYLFLTRWPTSRFNAFSDYVGIAVSVLIGATFVVILPIHSIRRSVSLIVYVPVLATLLFFYSFWLVAIIFRDGL